MWWKKVIAMATAVVSLLTILGVVASASESAPSESSCAIARYGYTGYRICNPNTTILTNPWWRDNTQETFVVGSDHAVWHIWPGSGGWHSMGGGALADGTADLDAWYSTKLHHVIAVYAPDYHWWCSVLIGSTWAGWVRDKPNCTNR